MGIQLYIKTEALEARGIEFTTTKEVVCNGCHCGAVQQEGAFCDECHSYAQTWTDDRTQVEGLAITMHNTGETLWSDANRWGSNRAPLIDFINHHKLLAGSEWYEG